MMKGGYGAMGKGGNNFKRFGPYDNGPRETAMCSEHGKKRSLDCMDLDPTSGQYICTPQNMCKQSSAEDGGMGTITETCSVHGKKRQMNCLMDDGFGGWQCIGEDECKMGKGGGRGGKNNNNNSWGGGNDYNNRQGPMDGNNNRSTGTGCCSVHQKPRSWDVLCEDGYGGYMCSPPNVCKVGRDSDNMYPPPQNNNRGNKGKGGKGKGRGGGGGNADTEMCEVHGKRRSMSNLQQGFAGGFECMPGFECKGANSDGFGDSMGGFNNTETALCSVHGKNRSMNVLIDDGMGGFACNEQNECKSGRPSF